MHYYLRLLRAGGVQVWKDKVLPHLAKHLAQKVDTVLTYLLLYHELGVVNLLEVGPHHAWHERNPHLQARPHASPHAGPHVPPTCLRVHQRGVSAGAG